MILDPKQIEGSPRAEVLRFIQRQGSASIKELEAAMGVTTTAVREQVANLLNEGFLQATRVRGEIGRPYYVYSLTAKAQDLFPKDYATLAQLLLEETLAMQGPEGLRSLLNRVSRRMAEKFDEQGEGKELAQKLLGLVGTLGQQGLEVSMLPVKVEQEEEKKEEQEPEKSNFVLKMHACPYFDVAIGHREICEMEQEMLADLLGPGVGVKLSGRIVDGQRACDFHVSTIPIDKIAKAKKETITSVGTPE